MTGSKYILRITIGYFWGGDVPTDYSTLYSFLNFTAKMSIFYFILLVNDDLGKGEVICFVFLGGGGCLFLFFLGQHPRYMEGPRLSCQPPPQSQQHWIQASSVTYTTADGHTRSLTHWARPGVEHATPWFPVAFIHHRVMMGTPCYFKKRKKKLWKSNNFLLFIK